MLLCLFLVSMQTVQRAEFWGATVAMQACWSCHLGIDNLDVARTVGRLLDKDCLVKPLPLVKDGDSVALVQYMIRTRGRETVRVTMSLDRSNWPRCLLWHGGMMNDKPWALSFGELASLHLERCLGAYPADFSSSWTPPDYWDVDDIALEMSDHPNIWTDGSREDYSSIGDFEVAGAVYLPASEVAFEGAVWGVAQEYGMLAWRVAVLLCLSLGRHRLFSVKSFAAPFLPCRVTAELSLCRWSRMGIRSLLLSA